VCYSEPMATPVGTRIRKAYGTVLRECRKAVRLSQDEVPGIGRTHVSSLEQGRKEVGLEMQFVLSDSLGVPVSAMLDRTERLVRSSATLERFERLSKAKILMGSDTCPKCGAAYAVFARTSKTRERDKYNCLYCGQLLGSWRLPFELIYETERLPPRVK
jgi:transcriptional regulator with XRE-family HTH domain